LFEFENALSVALYYGSLSDSLIAKQNYLEFDRSLNGRVEAASQRFIHSLIIFHLLLQRMMERTSKYETAPAPIKWQQDHLLKVNQISPFLWRFFTTQDYRARPEAARASFDIQG